MPTSLQAPAGDIGQVGNPGLQAVKDVGRVDDGGAALLTLLGVNTAGVLHTPDRATYVHGRHSKNPVISGRAEAVNMQIWDCCPTRLLCASSHPVLSNWRLLGEGPAWEHPGC